MELGSLAAWVSAVVSGGGLSVAAYQIRAGRREAEAARQREYQAEEDRREAMARAVGVTMSWQPGDDGGPPKGHDGLMPFHAVVLNAGEYPLSGAVLEIAADDYPTEIVYGTILPGQRIEETSKTRRMEVVFGEFMGGATLFFTDTYGNHWARTPHSLERRDRPARIC